MWILRTISVRVGHSVIAKKEKRRTQNRAEQWQVIRISVKDVLFSLTIIGVCQWFVMVDRGHVYSRNDRLWKSQTVSGEDSENHCTRSEKEYELFYRSLKKKCQQEKKILEK